jgi:hypothetical protein
MNECYVRGSTIKYLRIPDEVIDMVKEENTARMKAAKVVEINEDFHYLFFRTEIATKITETTAEEAEAATAVAAEVVEAAAAVVEVAEAVVVEAAAATTINRLLFNVYFANCPPLEIIQQSVIFLFRVILPARKSFFPFSSNEKIFRASSTTFKQLISDLIRTRK